MHAIDLVIFKILFEVLKVSLLLFWINFACFELLYEIDRNGTASQMKAEWNYYHHHS